MNQQLKKYLRIDSQDPIKNLEVRNIVQYFFQTKKHIEKKRQESRY